MTDIKKHIPNAVTMLSLVCGLLAIISAFSLNFEAAFILIVCAAVFDFLDGFVALVLHAQSELGKQLDSLIDMVSFGVAPTFVIYFYITTHIISCNSQCFTWLPAVSFLLAIASAFRLGKFNIDTTQTTYFKGLPTPANALFFVSLPALFDFLNSCNGSLGSTSVYIVIALVVLFSFLMISTIPMFSLKIKKLNWADNKLQFSFLLLSVVLIGLIHAVAVVPVIILLYVVLSILFFKPTQQ